MEAGHLLGGGRARSLFIGLGIAALAIAWIGPTAAQATDARLADAQRVRQERQERLDVLYGQITSLEADQERLTGLLDDLVAQQQADQAEADSALEALRVRVRESYMNGSSDPTLAILASGSTQEATEQARLLALLAQRGQGEVEGAVAARTRTQAAAEAVRDARAALDANRAELEAAVTEARELVAQAEAELRTVGEVIAAEERERLLREGRNGSFVGTGGPPGQIVGDIACPVGDPVSYRDTWGAARSGGRSHKGVDMLAEIGIPIYAYENGVVTRKNNNGLGGTSLYLQGDSGNQYYYTHLSGYVSGIDAGDRVDVGTHIAYVGDTGNAAGIPHLHWEVHPGGGSPVNPYPYAFKACG